jgi:hypothetical protein
MSRSPNKSSSKSSTGKPSPKAAPATVKENNGARGKKAQEPKEPEHPVLKNLRDAAHSTSPPSPSSSHTTTSSISASSKKEMSAKEKEDLFVKMKIRSNEINNRLRHHKDEIAVLKKESVLLDHVIACKDGLTIVYGEGKTGSLIENDERFEILYEGEYDIQVFADLKNEEKSSDWTYDLSSPNNMLRIHKYEPTNNEDDDDDDESDHDEERHDDSSDSDTPLEAPSELPQKKDDPKKREVPKRNTQNDKKKIVPKDEPKQELKRMGDTGFNVHLPPFEQEEIDDVCEEGLWKVNAEKTRLMCAFTVPILVVRTRIEKVAERAKTNPVEMVPNASEQLRASIAKLRGAISRPRTTSSNDSTSYTSDSDDDGDDDGSSDEEEE